MSDYDCTKCGACCVAQTPRDYVPVTRLDRRRMPTKYQKKLVDASTIDDPEREPDHLYALPLKRFDTHFLACTALKGRLFKEARCEMYEQRPAFCRVLVPGSEDCQARRLAHTTKEETT